SWLTLKENTWTVAQLGPQEKISAPKAFPFRVETSGYTDSGFVGSLKLEILINGVSVSSQNLLVFPIPVSRYLTDSADLVVCDGRSLSVPTYRNAAYTIAEEIISGGKGNGNGILEPGEQAVLYVRLPQGLGPEDINTFH